MPWIAGKVAKFDNTGADTEEFKAELINEGGANEGIQERRAELVDRLQQAGQKKPASGGQKEEEHYWKEWFSIVDKHAKNSTLKYEWWSQNKVDEAGILSLEGAKAVNETGTNDANAEVVGKQ